MAGLLGRPRPLAGRLASLAGLAGLAVFYAAIHALGDFHAPEETWILQLAGIEIWREYAVLFALPVSVAGFVAGQVMGGEAVRA